MATPMKAARVKKLAPKMPDASTPKADTDAETADLIMEGRAWNEDDGMPVVPAELRPKKKRVTT